MCRSHSNPASPRRLTPPIPKPRVGAFAELVTLSSNLVRPIPEGLDFATAASYQAAALTAYVALVRCGHLEHGETLLVHGASGGVGVAAIQLGKHLGARGETIDASRVRASMGGIEIFSGGVFRLDPTKEAALIAHLRGAELYASAGSIGGVVPNSFAGVTWNAEIWTKTAA